MTESENGQELSLIQLGFADDIITHAHPRMTREAAVDSAESDGQHWREAGRRKLAIEQQAALQTVSIRGAGQCPGAKNR